MLNPGDTNPLVIILKSYLKVLGRYPIASAPSEEFDQSTQQAVIAFKTEKGLGNQSEATVDDPTWRKLIEEAQKVFPPIGTIDLLQISSSVPTTKTEKIEKSGHNHLFKCPDDELHHSSNSL